MQTANQARADCSVGQTAHAGVKIDQLKKAIALVSELIAATRLADGSSPPSDKSSPPNISGARASPPNLSRSGAGLYAPHLSSGDTRSQDSPTDHESRKRCASSMTEGDRALKAMKMEPPDDFSQPPLSSIPFSSAVGPGSAGIVNSHPVSFASNPPSSPPSRPASSAGLPLHQQLNVFQRQLPSSVSMNFPPLNVAAANGRPSDFTPPTSATQPPVSSHMASFGHPQEPWGEHSGPFAPSNRPNLSGSHLNGDVEMKNIIIGGPPEFASPAAGFPSLPGATPATAFAPSLLQGASRTSRSNSLSNPPSGDPFAFGVPVSEATIDERAEYRVSASRPDTGFSRSYSPISSPDDDDEHDSDTGSPSHSRYRGRHGSIGEANHFSRPLPRRALVNRSSTDNFSAGVGANGSGSSSHSNEVPQEYRAEVDRIFFEFLNKICSNRVFYAPLKRCMR
jgi:hypothetical protein